jgi:hypothetical protein
VCEQNLRIILTAKCQKGVRHIAQLQQIGQNYKTVGKAKKIMAHITEMSYQFPYDEQSFIELNKLQLLVFAAYEAFYGGSIMPLERKVLQN